MKNGTKKIEIINTTLLLASSFTVFNCSNAVAKDLQTDVVVVGAGASGITASLQLADYGAKVITLEKQPNAGGTGNYCEGQLAINSPIQKKNGINISKEEAFNALMNYGHWNGTPELVSNYLENSGEALSGC